jgi:hypothetical protein
MDRLNMQQENIEQRRYRLTAIDKCFFGQKSALKLQYNQDNNAIFLGIGKKEDNGNWNWRNAKIKDTEAAEIIRVISGQTDTPSFYHSYNDNNTKIWISRKEDRMVARIEDHSKALAPDEQVVLKILLKEAIVRASRGSAHHVNTRSSAGSNSADRIVATVSCP